MMKKRPYTVPMSGRVLFLLIGGVALGLPLTAVLSSSIFGFFGWDLKAAILAALLFAPLMVCAGLGWALWRWTTCRPQPLLSLHRRLSVACLLLLSWPLWSGILAFYADLSRPWLDPALAQAWQETPQLYTPENTHDALTALDQGHGIGTHWTLMLPSGLRPFYVFAGPLGDSPRPVVATITAPTAEQPAYFSPWNSQRADALFRRIHTDLLMPKPIGRFLAGVGGLFLALVVLSGLFAHRRAFRDAWRWRGQKPRIALGDGHKRLGLWILPYLLVMGLTGAVLGMKVYTVPIAALGLNGFDPAAARQAMRQAPAAPSPDTLTEVQGCLIAFETATIDWSPSRILRRGDHILFEGSPRDDLEWSGDGAGAERLSCHLATARLSPAPSLSDAPWTSVVESALRPIHYGRFGGVGMALLYSILGLIGMWVVDSGIRLMQDHRTDRAPLALRLQGASNSLFLALPWLMLLASLMQRSIPLGLLAFLCAAVSLWFCWPIFDRARHAIRRGAWGLGGAAWGCLPLIRWAIQNQGPRLDITAVGDLTALGLAGWMVWKSRQFR
jgi:uncharacterized iron-regulated membrane protein